MKFFWFLWQTLWRGIKHSNTANKPTIFLPADADLSTAVVLKIQAAFYEHVCTKVHIFQPKFQRFDPKPGSDQKSAVAVAPIRLDDGDACNSVCQAPSAGIRN